jgi:hypothetical protein
MDLENHLITTGGAGRNIHIFLDHFYRYFREDHRVILHHQEGIKVVGNIFGTEAMSIAENHIRDDWYGGMPLGHYDIKFYRMVWAYDIHSFMEAYEFAEEFLKYWLERLENVPNY